MTTRPSSPTTAFRLGVNYWPARTAMNLWRDFDAAEMATDFAQIVAAGLDSIRLFLTWEHFQPRPGKANPQARRHLVTALELAEEAGLLVMPTLFTGHMSGVNWAPEWTLGGGDGDRRFRVVSGGKVRNVGLLNWYADPAVGHLQAELARELSRAVAHHPALWAWDLGNENSNCVVPPTRGLGREWLLRMSDAIREGDPGALVTVGLHMEDLEQDRNLGPTEAAEVCDFLTMHGYPGYASFARGATDESLLPFLADVTRWLAGGADVLFSEFGVPTYRLDDEEGKLARSARQTVLVEEAEGGAYVARALDALHASGCVGAMLWCYADYVAAIRDQPPFDLAVHELHFGLWRADGAPKPVVELLKGMSQRLSSPPPPAVTPSWIDMEPRDFYRSTRTDLPRLYQRYRASRL